MRCSKCGGYIIISRNPLYGDCGYCIECGKWFDNDDFEVLKAKNVTESLIEKVGIGNDLK
jgi:hypothetical protein